MEIKGLSPEEIQKLLSSSRTRNMYGPKLLEFMESDEAAINPRDVWPAEFNGKTSSTIYQGFNNAIKNGKLEGVRIAQNDGEVFLLNTAKVEIAMAELADAA